MRYPTDILADYPYRDVMHIGGFLKNGRPALTGIDPQQVAEYVILMVNDPLIQDGCSAEENTKKFLEAPRLVGKTGLVTAWTGVYHGMDVTLVSCGSGGGEAEIVLVELMQYSRANTYIRVGGAGGISTEMELGAVAIASGAVRDEGLTKEYITPAFPAVSSYEVVSAMVQGAERVRTPYRVGIGRSTDSEHLGVGRPSVKGYFQPRHTQLLDYYHRAGVLYTDRESAAVVGLCALLGYRGGAVCVVPNNLLTGEEVPMDNAQELALTVALEGLTVLREMDRTKAERQKKYWYPEINER